MKKIGLLLIAAMFMVSCATMEDKVQQMSQEVTEQQNQFSARQWESQINRFMELYSLYLDNAVEVLSRESVQEKDLQQLQTLQNEFTKTFVILEKHKDAYAGELVEADFQKFAELYKKGSALITVGVTAKSAKPL